MTLEIRKATLADADGIAGVLTQLGYLQTEEFVRKKIVQLSGHPDTDLAVATEHEEPSVSSRSILFRRLLPPVPSFESAICVWMKRPGIKVSGTTGIAL